MESQEIVLLLKDIQEQIRSLREDFASSNQIVLPTRGTSSLGELFTALAKAQAEMVPAERNKENPYFKVRYADLKAVVNASRPALAKHGLAVIQDLLTSEENQIFLHTILTHTSGQYIESRMRVIPPKADIQSISSYITYLKRISYASLVGVVIGDEDDDGEAATEPYRNIKLKKPSLPQHPDHRENLGESITREQLEELEYELSRHLELVGKEDNDDLVDKILEAYNIRSLCDIPKEKFGTAINRVRKIVQEFEEPS